ncbi:MAG: AI-2E family transporter [Eubacteriales bacterium]|nr:AI-2E family transporter [Eubacteriales bacterium]
MKIKLEKKHLQWGLTLFLVIICSVIVFFGIFRADVLATFFNTFVKVLAPLIYGLVMAYLLCPIYNFSVRESYHLMNRGKYKFKYDLTLSKVIGTIISMTVLLVTIGGILWMIIPGLVDSIINVIEVLPSGLEKFTAWVDVKFQNLPIAKETLEEWSNTVTQYALDYATNTIIPHSGSLAVAISDRLIGAFGVVFNFFIGIIVSVYFLNMKDTLSAQAKKIIVANFKESTAEEILEGADYTNKTFGGFISGNIIDSAIVGIICFLVMSIFGWEYSLLISCIIGISNIIPFFGPFIGAVPSALLLLMVNPWHCLYFIIFILILQQFDGNILSPKILGDSTGLASFWVLFAALVGGGLFGFIGMVLSIPVFAVIYAYLSRALNKRLAKKGFSTDTLDYKVDKYRTRGPNKRRLKPSLNDGNDDINLKDYFADNHYENSEVQHTSEEEIRQAEEAGREVIEATVVEYDDSQLKQEKKDEE